MSERHAIQVGLPGGDLLWTVPEAARRLALSRSTIYELLAEGRLRGVRVGRARRVLVSSALAFLRELEAEEERDGRS